MTDHRRRLPAVNALLADAEREGLAALVPRQVLVDSVRAVLDRARGRDGDAPSGGWIDAVREELSLRTRPSLTRVINATGVVIHTNLGRAPLADAARSAAESAYRYSTLELDLDLGQRGSRQRHTRGLITEITGAEDGIVVTNAAAAVLLVLNSLASGGETIVSRSELVEIGGSFRIPDILQRSGSVLTEVGTTNRTRLRDYELAVSPRTRLVLKVHQSNFEITGFVEEVAIEDLVSFGRARGIPAVHDVGSGLLVDLSQWGLSGEPMVQDSVAAGATVVFSGDKLLGGPQAGIIAGPAEIVQRIAQNPLARALRPDKVIFAALEATLALYRDTAAALTEIPALTMLTADGTLLDERARGLADQIPGATTRQGASAVGGGAFAGVDLPTTLVSVPARSPDDILAALRNNDPPVIARAAEGAVLLDVRTMRDDETATVVEAVAAALRG
jgi:L-seryl-tRNA(Ser) seleniumtransferase